MTLTRANAETELVSRAKGKMELVGMAVTVVGTNADLNGPLSTALRKMGLAPASPITVTDTDLANLTDADIDEYLDRAELRLLENIHRNYTLVDIKSGPQDEKLSQLAAQLEKSIELLSAKIKSEYGDSGAGSSFSVGVTRIDGYSEEAESSE